MLFVVDWGFGFGVVDYVVFCGGFISFLMINVGVCFCMLDNVYKMFLIF